MEPIQRFLIGEGELFYLDENGDDPMFTIEHYHVNKVVCQKCGGGSGLVINSVDVRGVHRHVCDFDTVYINDGYLSPMVDYEYYEGMMQDFIGGPETCPIHDFDLPCPSCRIVAIAAGSEAV